MDEAELYTSNAPVTCTYRMLFQILSVIGGQLYELDLSGVSLNVTDKGLKYVTKYCVNLRVGVYTVAFLVLVHAFSCR